MRITNTTREKELASNAWTARGFWPRLVGLLRHAHLPSGEALILERCSSVHTAFMRFAIDVLYVDRSGRVVKAVSHLKPFRVSGARGDCTVIELPSGVIESTGTAAGDQLAFET